jgi:bacterial/archaeal transporter family protein
VAGWIAPTIGFVIATGLLGVTSKLALRSLQWQDLLIWTALAYAIVAVTVLATGGGRPRWTPDTPWAIVTGILPVASLVMFFLAIGAADASRVVPVSAIYPLVTVVAAWLLLNETITVTQALGMLLVIGGVVALTR